MTQKEAVMFAQLSERMTAMERQLNKNTSDTAAIKSSLDNLTGGKQALMYITGLMVSVGVIIATLLGFHK